MITNVVEKCTLTLEEWINRMCVPGDELTKHVSTDEGFVTTCLINKTRELAFLMSMDNVGTRKTREPTPEELREDAESARRLVQTKIKDLDDLIGSVEKASNNYEDHGGSGGKIVPWHVFQDIQDAARKVKNSQIRSAIDEITNSPPD